jgi:hypothetical protein
MPGDKARTIGLLDKEIGVPAQNVWTNHIFDCIENFWVMYQCISPGEKQMSLVSPVALQWLAGLGFISFEGCAVLMRILG